MESRRWEGGSDSSDAAPIKSSEIMIESLEQMLARQRKEATDLQNKEIALKKAAAKGSKAEQKAKKKKIEDDISLLTSQLKSRHSDELASLGYINGKNDNKKGNLDNLILSVTGISISNPTELAKPSKGAKRREKRAQQEAEREDRIQTEQNQIISNRMLENQKLAEMLTPLGLTVNEVKPDGHCLYRAVQEQLSLHPKKYRPYTYQELRKLAADYMREHAADFAPFFLSDGTIKNDSNDLPSDMFHKYCNEVEFTAAWGGQLELGALAHCLKGHIVIFSGFLPDVEMGKEYKSESGSIMLSYHKHAYGLGEHYNSVIPML